MMREMMAQMDALPLWVRLWTGWMMAVFFFAAAFVRHDAAARVVLGAFLLTMVVGMGLFAAARDVRVIAAAHLIVWTPLLAYLYKARSKDPSFALRSLKGAWLASLMLTMSVSLALDLRELALLFHAEY